MRSSARRPPGRTPAAPHPGYSSGDGRLLLDCGPGVLARLREHEDVAERRRDRDHPLPPRPLGRPRPLGLGSAYGPGRDLPAAGAVAPARRPRAAAAARRRLGRAACSRRASTSREYEARTAVRGRRVRVTPLRVAALHARDVRLPGRRRTERRSAYSGDAGPCEALVDAARDADLFVCEATLDARRAGRDSRGPPRPPTRRSTPSAASGAGDCCSRTGPPSSPLAGRRRGWPTTGSRSTVVARRRRSGRSPSRCAASARPIRRRSRTPVRHEQRTRRTRAAAETRGRCATSNGDRARLRCCAPVAALALPRRAAEAPRPDGDHRHRTTRAGLAATRLAPAPSPQTRERRRPCRRSSGRPASP